MRYIAALLAAAALSLVPGTAFAAPGDPWVAYVANSVVTKQSSAAPVILRADPATGGLTEISRNGAQGDLFRHPYDIVVAGDGSLLVADMGAFATSTDHSADGRIIRVDPVTGQQTIVSSGNLLVDPAGLTIAPDGLIYVVENVGTLGTPSVISVNPATGAQTLVTQGGAALLPVRHRRRGRRLAARHELRRLLGRQHRDQLRVRLRRADPDRGGHPRPVDRVAERRPVGQPVPQSARRHGRAGRAHPGREPERRHGARGGRSRDRGPGRRDTEHRDRPRGRPSAPGGDPGRRRGAHRLRARRPGGRARLRGPPRRRAEHPAPGQAALQQPARSGGRGEPCPGGGGVGVAGGRGPGPGGDLRRLCLERPGGPRAPLRLGPRRQRELRDRRRHEPHGHEGLLGLDHAHRARARERSARRHGRGRNARARRRGPAGAQPAPCPGRLDHVPPQRGRARDDPAAAEGRQALARRADPPAERRGRKEPAAAECSGAGVEEEAESACATAPRPWRWMRWATARPR